MVQSEEGLDFKPQYQKKKNYTLWNFILILSTLSPVIWDFKEKNVDYHTIATKKFSQRTAKVSVLFYKPWVLKYIAISTHQSDFQKNLYQNIFYEDIYFSDTGVAKQETLKSSLGTGIIVLNRVHI
jgi:hypothetical protein